jgi:flagellar hook-length control protein FliK
MQLPAFVRSGDIIALQVASLQPRLTFTLAASSNPVSTPESLSATSRLLSSLSQQPLERSYVRSIQSAPLWTGTQALPDTAQLAGKLHDALSHSGLFYESHQAQWIAGTRPTTQLLLEPQNQLTPKQQIVLQQNANARSADTASNATLSAQVTQTGTEQRPVAPNIPEHLQTLVQQQLGALETHQVLWQGQVWQGQEMRWEVSEETPHRNAQGVEEGQWNTQIHLDLPNLGGVSARLSFNGNALNLSLDVSDAQTRDKLGNASSQLVAALSERGIPVTHTQITQNEHAG